MEASQRRSHLHRTGKLRTTGCPPLLSGIASATRISAASLTEQQIARVVKNPAAAAGQPPEVVATLAAHSLRSGIATTAEAAGAPREVIARLLGHAAGTTSLYIRPSWDDLLHQLVYGLAERHFLAAKA